MGKFKKLSIVIPAYNEQNTITEILEEIRLVDFQIDSVEIVIVNDASTDKTGLLAQNFADRQDQNSNLKVKVLKHSVNKGKSQAVKTGILATTGDLVVIQDADLEYNPENLVDFVEMFKDNPGLDVIYGNRFGKDNKVIYWKNWLGNKFLTFISNLFTYPRSRIWFRDMEVCYKMAKGGIFRDLAKGIESTSNFGFEPEITAKLSRYKKKTGRGLEFEQIAIDYSPRTIEEGKHMNAFRDGFKALTEIFKFNLT
jgi:glycosyltransferase involved in cell wall biosynthesis